MKQQINLIIHFLSLKLPVELSRVSNNFPFHFTRIMIELIRPIIRLNAFNEITKFYSIKQSKRSKKKLKKKFKKGGLVPPNSVLKDTVLIPHITSHNPQTSQTKSSSMGEAEFQHRVLLLGSRPQSINHTLYYFTPNLCILILTYGLFLNLHT